MDKQGWLLWKEDQLVTEAEKPIFRRDNRETLARVYLDFVRRVQKRAVWEEASRFVRSLWIEECPPARPKTLPRIIGEDGFLRMYALGEPLPTDIYYRILDRLDEPFEEKTIELNPICVEWNKDFTHFFDEDATPPGVLAKLFTRKRLKTDKIQLDHVRHDLEQIAQLVDNDRRRFLTLAVLSHGAAYREIEGKILKIPSFFESGKLNSYRCHKHLIAEGVRTVSVEPLHKDAVPIYLCQGTELWPSQPSMIGSIMANFGPHGSATEAYAHSWRRIHKHLRDLHNGHFPYVAGHSMGGSMAMQIGLYSHDLIEKSYAFNPPLPNDRDYKFYHKMDEERQKKVIVSANLDDFAFWRIGAKIIGNVTLYLSKRRWRYYPVGLWDCILIIPAFAKFILNVRHAFPAHQNIFALSENWVSFVPTQAEIEREHQERRTRFDYLRFFPKLYDPMKVMFPFLNRLFRWHMEAQYLRNEIEIIALHERDLIDALTDENRDVIEQELRELHRQKQILRKQLLRIKK